MDRNQIIISIVTNIVAAIIIWLVQRLVRWLISLLRAGMVAARLKTIFSPSAIAIVGSLLIVLFDMWLLGRLVWRGGPFGRADLLAAITISLLVAYWIGRVTSLRTRPELTEARMRLAELERRDELRRDRRLSDEQREQLLELLQGQSVAPYVLRRGAATNEIKDFANDIGAVMERAGWRVLNGETMLTAGARGVKVLTPEQDNDAAISLREALNAIGVPCDLEQADRQAGIVLHIGEK